MTDLTDPVETFVREGTAFVRRHADLNDAQRAMGGVAAGMMKAVLECPDHPGTFRVPLDPGWVVLLCPLDGETWATKDGQPPRLE